MRRFDEYTEDKKIRSLLLAIGFTVTSNSDTRKQDPNPYVVAANDYGKMHGLRPEDFNLIKHETIDNLLKKLKV